ncbi:type III-B CRISPR module-associated protein Cmr3 [Paenibacillus sp. J5C_2022]|uniref:type III-B CRISPR module-associated protein Cmr3 n=1 Tax=Paenibacillus sp. J5C2022 TaxID=2977129 RepID=UPI0021D17884|nr:type III-B CRISPR module-associated protein Cmr3 [Paenibacillus sp. J5C2022]MCU6711412.1 type III-B CRISPR module-associated protein Cmr3 [Paenibacillus sp. J5C2022]
MRKYIQVRPLDPLLLRDGRPFDATPGETAHSMSDVMPSVLAGSIRTMLAKALSAHEHIAEVFHTKQSQKIRQLVVKGPIYVCNGRRFYPMPIDMFVHKGNNSIDVYALRPVDGQYEEGDRGGFLGTGKQGAHESELWPIAMPRGKACLDTPSYISEERLYEWLIRSDDEAVQTRLASELEEWSRGQSSEHYLAPFQMDERTSTAIDRNTYIAKDSALFTVKMLALPHDVSLLAEVQWKEEWEWPHGLTTIHSMGGKRRLAHFQEEESLTFPACNESILTSLREARYVRMVLSTPAYFRKGWKPNWLDESLVTKDEWMCKNKLKLQLRWACVPGYVPVSGWSYSGGSKRNDQKSDENEKQTGHEKAVRRMVPAGSVYFFEVLEGDAGVLAESYWLASVSDTDRRKGSFDQEDGFGLALWGAWRPAEGMTGEGKRDGELL